MFGNIYIDRLSFWLGFLAGGILVWFFGKLRVLAPQIRKKIADRIQVTRANMAAGADLRFRNETILLAQRQHLAAQLFSLDEILIPPHILAPPQQTQVETENPLQDNFTLTLPYLPDWPQLGASYCGKTLSLPQALEGGSNLILLGLPGSGKTVALAYLATLLARRSPEAGELARLLPVLVHAADLPLPATGEQDPLEVLEAWVAEHVTPLTQTRLGGLLRSSFESGNAMLLVDGLDEMAPEAIDQVVDFLRALRMEYAKVRLAAAASPDYFDGLTSAGLVPVAMAAWTERERKTFIERWSEMWARYVKRGLSAPEEVDHLLLNNWLAAPGSVPTPFDLTLKVWAAYAGDVRGPNSSAGLEAYLRRMTASFPKARILLEKLAAEMVMEMSPSLSLKQVEKWEMEAPQPGSSSPGGPEGGESLPSPAGEALMETPRKEDGKPAGTKIASPEIFSAQRALPELVASGVLVSRRNNRISFSHPVIAGFLSGTFLASSGGAEELMNQPQWTGVSLAIRYASACTDISDLALSMLENKDDPLSRKTVAVWRWLDEAPKSARWRGAAMRKTASVIQHEVLSMSARAKAVVALATSGDPGAGVLFRQLLNNPSENVRQLAALGCGMTRDPKAVEDLANLAAGDASLAASRAAIMALGSIANKPALDAIADILLNGSEEMRRAAAEVLANDPEEGHPTLEEGSQVEDLLVRRAVVYGLMRVGEPWARQILEKMQIEDGQWVVRTAADQAVEQLNSPNPCVPRPLPALAQTPWLIVFAGKQGMGVSPGKPAMDLLLQALKSGEPEERLAALEYLALHGDATFIPQIYHILYGCEGELREAAYYTLWCLAGSGVPLPSPTQFGLG